MTGTLLRFNPEDLYRVSLTDRRSVTAVLGALDAPIQFELLGSNGGRVAGSSAAGNADRTLTADLGPGTFYVRVFLDNAVGSDYSLTLTTGAPTPGPTPTPTPTTPPGTSRGAPIPAFKGPRTTRKTYKFNVRYTDGDGVDPATVGPDDVLVTGPRDFSQVASLGKVKASRRGTVLTAQYIVTPPNNIWYTRHNGEYQVTLQPGAVADASGNATPAEGLGTFAVNSRRSDPLGVPVPPLPLDAAPLLPASPDTDAAGVDDDEERRRAQTVLP